MAIDLPPIDILMPRAPAIELIAPPALIRATDLSIVHAARKEHARVLRRATFPFPVFMPGGVQTFTIAADAANLNLFAVAGSPSSPGQFVFIINSGVVVYSTATTNGALSDYAGFPAGSTVKIINYGYIIGMGGAGGGQYQDGNGGGPAIILGINYAIDNTNGFIYGGGGGGGGGGDGGGGGGQSYQSSAGGTGTYGDYNGGNGTFSGPGIGGGHPYDWAGGDGGVWGTAGDTSPYGYVGGAGGPAIILNGQSVTWLGGNDSTHVKGAVA